MNKRTLLYAIIALVAATVMSSCKKSDNTSSSTDVVYGSSPSSAMITHFALKPNTKVLANIDSVHFAIDQQKGLIYNPDSLPMGTNVTKLLTSIRFGTSISKAEFIVKGGKVITEEKKFEYKDTSTDSIDFTGTVLLNVTSADGSKVMTYNIKVNVHQVQPDSLCFPITERRDLPAAGDTNYAVGMAQLGDTFYSLIHNSNGRYLATGSTPTGKWETEHISLPFVAEENTLTTAGNALYLLDDLGNLWTSKDAKNWTATGAVWKTILGAYENRLLGVKQQGNAMLFDEYPRRESFHPSLLPDGFPVTGASQMIVAHNDWALHPMALIVGGRDDMGEVTGCTWGYDGEQWGIVSSSINNAMPALEGVTLVSYYSYELSSVTQVATKKVTWLVMGGRTANGAFNRKTYISRNMGITWVEGASGLQLPNYIPAFAGAKAFVCNETASLKSPAKRVTKPITEWDVPYLYIVGGTDANGALLNNVWKGTITRMTFKPVY